MFSRRSDKLCKMKPHGMYCTKHQKYNQYLNEYTVEDIRKFPKCTECQMQFLEKDKPYWKVCFECQQKQNRYYCKWYSRQDLEDKPSRCSWRAIENTDTCCHHKDIPVDWFDKPVKYCSGCRLPYPLDIFNGAATCKKCLNTCSLNREKARATHVQCLGIVSSTNSQCTNKASNKGFCLKHYFSDYVVPDMDLKGYQMCVTHYGCNTFIPKNKFVKTCMNCRIKGKIYDTNRNDQDADVDKLLFEQLCKNPCFYCSSNTGLNGVDRYVNDAKHININSVACCTTCNRAKNTHSIVDFINMCEHITVLQFSIAGKLYPKLFQSPVRVEYLEYQSKAKDRSIKFELSEQEFKSIITDTRCTHCRKLGLLGVDRIDSNLGYTVSNCQPSCSTCNLLKLDQSDKEFYARCKRIFERKQTILNFDPETYNKTLTISSSSDNLEILTGYDVDRKLFIEK